MMKMMTNNENSSIKSIKLIYKIFRSVSNEPRTHSWPPAKESRLSASKARSHTTHVVDVDLKRSRGGVRCRENRSRNRWSTVASLTELM